MLCARWAKNEKVRLASIFSSLIDLCFCEEKKGWVPETNLISYQELPFLSYLSWHLHKSRYTSQGIVISYLYTVPWQKSVTKSRDWRCSWRKFVFVCQPMRTIRYFMCENCNAEDFGFWVCFFFRFLGQLLSNYKNFDSQNVQNRYNPLQKRSTQWRIQEFKNRGAVPARYNIWCLMIVLMPLHT